MNNVIGRWLHAIGAPALACGLLFFGTGCGAIKAAGNPKVAWALNDPAPMSVVVRRADVAEKTAANVDKVLTDTPVTDDAPWLAKVTPNVEEATKTMTAARSHDLYATTPVRVVQAEYWAKSLSDVAPKSTPPAKAPVVAADEKKATKKDKGALTRDDKDDRKRGKKPSPRGEESTLAVAAPAATKYASILAAVDADLGDAWSKVMEKRKALADIETQIATEEAAKEEKNADKAARDKAIAALEKQKDPLSNQIEKLQNDFVPKAKAAAQKSTPEVREKFGPVLVSLRQAVEDADISNGAAAIRYPFAVSSVLDSAKQMASVYVGDVVEEKTGKRPQTGGLQPGVTLEGGDVQVTINGLTSADLGKLSVGDVTKEVASRTSKWVKRATGLLGTISSTKGTLAFEGDVLGALLEGFKAAGYALPAPVAIPEAPAPGGAPAGGAPNG